MSKDFAFEETRRLMEEVYALQEQGGCGKFAWNTQLKEYAKQEKDLYIEAEVTGVPVWYLRQLKHWGTEKVGPSCYRYLYKVDVDHRGHYIEESGVWPVYYRGAVTIEDAKERFPNAAW